MAKENSVDPILYIVGLSMVLELLLKVLATGQPGTITLEQIQAKAAENKAAHETLQNTP